MAPKVIPDEPKGDAPPKEVRIRTKTREPETDPTLGVAVKVVRTGTPRHRLVTIGDSLTHGFQSGAIYNTDLSYPAIIAWELGWYQQFRRPHYEGFGGLPLNIEYLVRNLEGEFGESIDLLEVPLAALRVRHLMDEVEDWWERRVGSEPPNVAEINHNLGVYGWDLRDALVLTARKSLDAIERPKDQFLSQSVENANERAAVRVLASARGGLDLTPFQAAAALGAEGTEETAGKGPGIETLIVFLGSNNALSTVTQLRVSWSDKGYDDPDVKGRYNVWRPSHFAKEFDLVAAEVEKIQARHVIWATVPHVTIAPVARGVGAKERLGSRYFPYYTRPWIEDKDFDPANDPHLTGQQARAIDSAIDDYNDHITSVVRSARGRGLDWYLLDVCGLLDRLAARRYALDPSARPDWWTPYELPPELQALSPVPDTRFFRSDAGGRTMGGIFALDGVHPTTIGYGIVAQEFCNVMARAGVVFRSRGDTPRPTPVRVDFGRLVRLDSLISHPPVSLGSDLRLIGWLDERVDFLRRLMSRLS